MKRDWDVIREVLIEVEELGQSERSQFCYAVLHHEQQPAEQRVKAEHALLLWKARYLEATDASSGDGDCIISPQLTWTGHDLLDTLRSKTVWERIKTTAKDSGMELTFDTVKLLSGAAVKWAAGQAGIDLG